VHLLFLEEDAYKIVKNKQNDIFQRTGIHVNVKDITAKMVIKGSVNITDKELIPVQLNKWDKYHERRISWIIYWKMIN